MSTPIPTPVPFEVVAATPKSTHEGSYSKSSRFYQQSCALLMAFMMYLSVR